MLILTFGVLIISGEEVETSKFNLVSLLIPHEDQVVLPPTDYNTSLPADENSEKASLLHKDSSEWSYNGKSLHTNYCMYS